ncbi:MAG: ribonuclease P protein component [Rubrivivax sp.]
MIGRLQQAADFQRLLEAPVRRRSAHFCVHFLAAEPAIRLGRGTAAAANQLSTACEPILTPAVDKVAVPDAAAPSAAPRGRWLGCVVPKRHARRSVTRSLLKRQMRAAAERHATALAPGMWLLRLRSGFPVSQFPSASSDALRAAARAELDVLFQGRLREAA